MRPLPSVNGIVNTSGSVPAARAAVNVGAVQLYSSGSTVIHGYLSWNWPICSYSASTASWVTPGRRAPTTIVTGSRSATLGAAEAPVLGAADGAVLGVAPPQAASTVAVLTNAARTDAERRVVDRIAFSSLDIPSPRWVAGVSTSGGRPVVRVVASEPVSDRPRAPSSLGPSARYGRGAARPSRRAEGVPPRHPRLPAGPPHAAAAASRCWTGW